MIEILDLKELEEFNAEDIKTKFKETGLILFKNTGVKCSDTFRKFVSNFDENLMEYIYRSTPRDELSKYVYNSTIYPDHKGIPLHSEFSYSIKWNRSIWFYCDKFECEGGETTLCSTEKVLSELDEETKDRLREQGVLYRRIMGSGVDLNWQEVFQTDDKKAMEAKCDELLLKYEWKEEQLILESKGLGLVKHPLDNKELWFNQSNLFHPISLGADIYENLLTYFGDEGLPRNCYWGNGEKFENAFIEKLNASMDKLSFDVKWNEGDLVWVDNLKFMHGRKPFKGKRKLMVIMTNEYNGQQLVENLK